MIYMWKCLGCEIQIEISRPMAECTVPPEEPCLCADLPSQWRRIYEPAMIMKASYPDGHKRKGWSELKESAKLEVAAATAKPGTKAEIKREILKMGIKPGKD